MPAPRLLDTEAVAYAAGVKPVTVRQWANRGKLTRYGTRRRRLYDLFELRNLLVTRVDTFRDAV